MWMQALACVFVRRVAVARPLTVRWLCAVHAPPQPAHAYTECQAPHCVEPSHNHAHTPTPPVAGPRPRASDASTAAPVAAGCWSCGSCVNYAEWFCQTCDYIQPPSGEKNLFRLFAIPEAFDVPPERLERAYKTLQKFVHPDKFGNRTDRERDYSSQRSTELNRAYDILKNPASRAQHLLYLHGIDAISETASTAVDTSLLVEMMEKREALEEATGLCEVLKLKLDNDAGIAALLVQLAAAFRELRLAEARALTVRLQYYSKLRQEADEWLLRRDLKLH